VEAARAQVDRFHAAYNRRDYASMFELSGPSVKRTSSQAEFAKYEASVYEKLGDLRSAEIVNYNLLYLFGGPQVRIDYKCTYEKGTSTESFEVNFRNDKPQIDGYRLDSPQTDNK
jgi:hypothetical protein